jgi:molybdenum cofactor cytidylyltransferase
VSADIRGILLCGGTATRFGSDKLLAVPQAVRGERAASEPLVVLAARNLIAGAGNALAVIRPGARELRAELERAGCVVVESENCARGIGESLAAAVAASHDAAGWIVALGDMPYVRPATVEAVRAQLEIGALIAAPLNAVTGVRGHPVGFASTLHDELLALRGDSGARAVIARHHDELVPVPVDDPGIFVDIDTPEELARISGSDSHLHREEKGV